MIQPITGRPAQEPVSRLSYPQEAAVQRDSGQARAQKGSNEVPVTRSGQKNGSLSRRIGEKPQEKECETCKNRKYQDGSDDPGVSYKTPTTISADQAESAVRAHENQHVTRERAQARQEGREVVSQFVSLHTAICPECGRVYVSGGTTRTVTKAEEELAQDPQKKRFNVGLEGEPNEPAFLDSSI